MGRFITTRWIALFFVLGCILAGCAEENAYEPDSGISIDHYDLVLSVNEGPNIRGHVSFYLSYPDTLREFSLLARDLQVDSVSVNDRSASYERVASELTIRLPSDTLALVRVYFAGSPSEGMYHDEAREVTYTDGWPDRGGSWWPAVHHPAQPATWTFTLDHESGLQPIATGSRIAIDTADRRVTSTWELSDPAPTYSMAFALGPFSRVDDITVSSTSLSHYLLDEESEIPEGLRRIPQMLESGADLIGPYPYSAYNTAQIPFQWAGMENAGLAFLNADRYTDPKALEEVAAHEAYHQWFGNRAPIADWRDLWLSEGLTTYMTTWFFEIADGIEEGKEAQIRMAEISPSDRKSHHIMVPDQVENPWNHLTWVPYRKGGSVAHLLRLKMGDEQFSEAISTYFEAGTQRPQSTEDFKEIFERVSGVSLDDIFETWVYGNELPRLVTDWNASEQRLRWEVSGDNNTLEYLPWEIRVCQDAECQIVDGSSGEAELASSSTPELAPVGITLYVE